MHRSATRYIGLADDGTLGNTPVVRIATDAKEELAKVVRGTKKDGSMRSKKRPAQCSSSSYRQGWRSALHTR
jgi:hypothetical protein